MNILFPVILGVPLLAVFINLPISTSIFWWLAVSMATASTVISSRNLPTFTKMKLVIAKRDLSKYMPFVQLIFIIILVVAWVLLSQALWQLVTKGTL